MSVNLLQYGYLPYSASVSSECQPKAIDSQGPFVQSIVSVTKLLGENSAHKDIAVIFLLKNCKELLYSAKVPHIFLQKVRLTCLIF